MHVFLYHYNLSEIATLIQYKDLVVLDLLADKSETVIFEEFWLGSKTQTSDHQNWFNLEEATQLNAARGNRARENALK